MSIYYCYHLCFQLSLWQLESYGSTGEQLTFIAVGMVGVFPAAVLGK